MLTPALGITTQPCLSLADTPGHGDHSAFPATRDAVTAPSLHPHHSRAMRHSRKAPSNPDLARTPPGLTAPQLPVLEEGSRGLLPAQGGPHLPVRPARWLHLHGTKAVLFGGPRAVVPAQSIACWSGAGPGSAADADGSRWDPGLPEGLGPDMGSGDTGRSGVLCQSRMGTESLLLIF